MTSNRLPDEFLGSLPALQPGWVWLVGGGPGDPGLITALGLKALCDADIILHDALIDERLEDHFCSGHRLLNHALRPFLFPTDDHTPPIPGRAKSAN